MTSHKQFLFISATAFKITGLLPMSITYCCNN